MIKSTKSSLRATAQEEPPPPSPSTFSCCENNIKVTEGEAVPQKTVQGAGTITVTIDFKLKLDWRCDEVVEQDCLAFYKVSIKNSNWQEFSGGNWVDVLKVKESVTPGPPLKTKCDGKTHKGIWCYTYKAVITTTNKIRNTSLIFDWDVVPTEKGQSYSSEYEVSGVSPTTGTKRPNVKGKKPKKK